MMTLFNDEYILKTYVESERREAAEAAAEAIEKSKRLAQKMFRKGDAVEYIADFLDASVEEVEEWLELSKMG